ncbi:MAG: phosphopantetheine-binding protein [Hungatella sp.]|jgi:acyl carrier protein|nr:phosphopantetheine-binding protein [Hungatella sp.]MDR2024685.1 phosphopantetheine-binding protein [Hungatella sp.]
MEIRKKIEKFLLRFIGNRTLQGEDNIFELGLVNSLFAVQLVSFVENEFDVIVENEDMDIENFKSINAIVSLVESKI